jgi:hypothetical protein
LFFQFQKYHHYNYLNKNNNICRNQMLNITNICRNQSVAWSNIIKNQTKNARDYLCEQFISMRKIVATQMYNCKRLVNGYMNDIVSSVNRSLNLTVNVKKNISLGFSLGSDGQSVNALSTFNTLSAMARSNNVIPMGNVGLGTLIGSAVAQSATSSDLSIEIPLYLDSKEIARASAKYMDGELKVINKRKNRRNGN